MLVIALCPLKINEAAAATNPDEVLKQRMDLYQRMESSFHIPWYYLAAVDQFEHTVRSTRRNVEPAKGAIGINIPPEKWTGAINPDKEDENPKTIKYFGGMGLDGNADGKASAKTDEDILISFTNYLLAFGSDEDHIRMALWDYYKRDKTVGIIMGNAKLYKHFGRLDLQEKAFPVPVRTHYSYRSTWGVARGWGGRRSHEGTDVFADYGLPVRSTCYGIIEMKGWNRFGGWRVGIRDINNTYHYFAHLSGFAKGLQSGQIVEPGMLIGGVGSTGYGPPGTSGKFPPHLHYGLYKDNGTTEWSFDPYPHLKLWERKDIAKKKKR
ncbi:peptidase M23 [Bacillus sp. M6-12]|nr:M23 family metallopeptidase [Bacillus sp. M6-12]PLS18124.1 peptidase M23 [Bacillus sp. M6-12]